MVVALLGWAVAAIGGVYLWAGVPIILGCAVLALLQRPRPAAAPETKLLDLSLLAFLGGIAFQLVPLPISLVTTLAPRAPGVRHSLTAPRGLSTQALSIDPDATLYGLLMAAATCGLFWSCREMFHQGGLRRVTRSVAWLGLAMSFLAIVHQATSSGLVYWWWEPIAEQANPFGPFVNRNHFATWVIMALPLAVGFVVARRNRGRRSRRKHRLAFLWQLTDLSAVWLTAATVLMTLALLASLSRSGVTGIVMAAGLGLWLVQARVVGWRGKAWFTAWGVLVVLIVLGWANVDLFLQRFDAALVEPTGGRLRIWRDTASVIRDFWLTGTGLGTYPTSMLVYQTSDRNVFFNQAHNHYMQLAAEGGLLLGLPLLVAAVAFVRLAHTRLQLDTSWRHWLRAGASVGLIAVAIQSFWEGGLRIPANALLAAVLASIAVHAPRRTESRDRPA